MHALRPIDLEQDERSSGARTSMQTKTKGKFWPKVRRQIWEKAQELFQMDEARTMGDDFKGITAERRELRESGYYATAKTLVLIEVNREKKGLLPEEEEYGRLQT